MSGRVGACCGEGIPACERVFDRRTAAADLRRLRRKGPPWATRVLLDQISAGVDLPATTVMDVGAGVGAVHLELLARGAVAAVDVDGSSAYLAVAREEAERRGVGHRVRHVLGDLVALGPTLAQADLVALDRVICCYADVPGLLTAAAGRARRRVSFAYPRDVWWIRAAVTLANPLAFRRSGGYRMRVHREATITDLLQGLGFARVARLDGRVWRVESWDRVEPGPGATAPVGVPE